MILSRHCSPTVVVIWWWTTPRWKILMAVYRTRSPSKVSDQTLSCLGPKLSPRYFFLRTRFMDILREIYTIFTYMSLLLYAVFHIRSLWFPIQILHIYVLQSCSILWRYNWQDCWEEIRIGETNPLYFRMLDPCTRWMIKSINQILSTNLCMAWIFFTLPYK